MEATYLDCSGSLYDVELRQHVEGETFYFDTQVYESDSKPIAGGGTSFRKVFEHAAIKGYTAIRIVTDGYGEFDAGVPRRALDPLKIDWVLVNR